MRKPQRQRSRTGARGSPPVPLQERRQRGSAHSHAARERVLSRPGDSIEKGVPERAGSRGERTRRGNGGAAAVFLQKTSGLSDHWDSARAGGQASVEPLTGRPRGITAGGTRDLQQPRALLLFVDVYIQRAVRIVGHLGKQSV